MNNDMVKELTADVDDIYGFCASGERHWNSRYEKRVYDKSEIPSRPYYVVARDKRLDGSELFGNNGATFYAVFPCKSMTDANLVIYNLTHLVECDHRTPDTDFTDVYVTESKPWFDGQFKVAVYDERATYHFKYVYPFHTREQAYGTWERERAMINGTI